ncbi:unnamed protein product [Orchesella dallaii]|uniref:Rrn7/TAF1B C-terminal cyclin domain-containing protein n=1 Tax=Orchesella dallaii TaxID=48710 RepID=A0ABP1RFD7_9HEXA
MNYNLETVQDDGPATQEACFICGESNFYSDGGFYYCSLCNTQSQTARLYTADEEYRVDSQRQHTGGVQVLRDKKRKTKKGMKDKQFLSTWEMYNILLKHLANQLVGIGFPETVKAKIFQLYTAFLIRRKVIFVSKSNPKEKSSVTCGEPQMNIFALYGVEPPPRKKAKSKNFGKKKTVPVVDKDLELEHHLPSVRKMLITGEKRKAMVQEYKAKATELSKVDTVFDEVAEKTQEENKKDAVKKPSYPRLVTTHGLRKLRRGGLMKNRVMMKNLLAKENTERDKNYLAAKRILEYERFSFKTALILIFVSMRQLGFPVVFSDILRLFYVGVLSFKDVDLGVYEENKQLAQRCRKFYGVINKYFSLRSSGAMIECFVKYIGIKNFYYPEMKEVVPKYCDEFVLPREFEVIISLLNHMFKFDDYINYDDRLKWAQFRSIPEVFVLTQILVVLKMFFGLDDRTEKFQSKFARLVNKVMNEEVAIRGWQMEEWTELFVIEDWFGYLQRRRELVKTELFSSLLYVPNKTLTMTKLHNLMPHDPREAETEDEIADEADYNEEKKAVKECRLLFENLLKKSLSESEQPDIPTIKPYIPLPLPTQSIVDQYLKNYPLVHDTSFKKELFQADFMKKRIDYIWNPKKYIKLLKRRGYTVKIVHGDAINNEFEPDPNIDESEMVLLFQPYKNFDEFVPNNKDEWSHSMKFLIELVEEITCKCSDSPAQANTIEFNRIMNAFSDIYMKSCLGGLIPLMSRVHDSDLSSDSD